jgi:hypothetical protein
MNEKEKIEKELKCPKCGFDMKVFINKLLCRNLSCREILTIDDLVDIIIKERQAKKELIDGLIKLKNKMCYYCQLVYHTYEEKCSKYKYRKENCLEMLKFEQLINKHKEKEL